MRDGSINCVAQCVIDYFKESTRGDGLTEARKEKINKWEEQVHEHGATIKDLKKLESFIERSIIVKDITGRDLYNTGKYRRYKKIEIIQHNEHAWSKNIQFPKIRKVKFFEEYRIWDALEDNLKQQTRLYG